MSDALRESYYHRIPALLQPILTWTSGVAHWKQRPIIQFTPVRRLFVYVTLLICGPTLGHIAMATWEMSPATASCAVVLSIFLTTSAMRRLDVSIVHQGLHHHVTRNRVIDRLIVEILTMILIRNPFEPNRAEHMHHHGHPCVEDDADVVYLRSLGHDSNTTPRELILLIIRNVLSPKHHFNYMRFRLRSNFSGRISPIRWAMSIGYLSGLAAMLLMPTLRSEVLILWIIPLVFAFQATVYFYTLSEHRWWLFDHHDHLPKDDRAFLTFGRSCGDPLPVDRLKLSNAGSWLLWWARLILLHIPYRLFFFVGDTVHHDLHHLRPNCDWHLSAYIRRDLMQSPNHGFQLVWGSPLDHLIEAIISPQARRSEQLKALHVSTSNVPSQVSAT